MPQSEEILRLVTKYGGERAIGIEHHCAERYTSSRRAEECASKTFGEIKKLVEAPPDPQVCSSCGGDPTTVLMSRADYNKHRDYVLKVATEKHDNHFYEDSWAVATFVLESVYKGLIRVMDPVEEPKNE